MNHKTWRSATVVHAAPAADDMLSLIIRPDDWLPHSAGQCYELRLPANDLSRKFSVVSSPTVEGTLEFGIQLLEYGEMSPKLWQLKAGDTLDIRGPLGSFTWKTAQAGPLVLMGAGSGITPLMGMYEHYKTTYPTGDVRFIISAKHQGRVMHYARLQEYAQTRFSVSQGRLDTASLRTILQGLPDGPDVRFYICGPGGFTGGMLKELATLGYTQASLQAESFN